MEGTKPTAHHTNIKNMATASPIVISRLPLILQRPTPTHTSISLTLNPNPVINSLNYCSSIREFSHLHAHLITTNLIFDPQLTTQVFRFLTSTDNLNYAHQICSYTHQLEATIWNTLLAIELEEGLLLEFVLTYNHMVTLGVFFNVSTYKLLINACSRWLDVGLGSEVHGRIWKSGLSENRSLGNSLMGFYSKCGKLEEVCQLFEKLHERDVVTWNTMISCYVSRGMYREAMSLFDKMVVDGVKPNKITMVSLVSACTKLRNLEMGERLHLYVEDNHIQISGSLLNCLVDMYVKFGKLEEAHKLSSRCHDSQRDVVLRTTLVSGYVKSNKIDQARGLFDQMEEKSLISWTTMMSGYVQGGYFFESLDLFRQTRLENVSLDEVALVTALSACAHMEDYELGRAIHGSIVTCGMVIDGFLGNALVDAYAKCKKLDEARLVFKQLPSKTVASWNSLLDGICRNGDVNEARNFFCNIPDKDIVSWNTMINFFVKQGMFTESFNLFLEMQISTVKPDKLTLISLLSSCARIGSLNHGIWIHVYIENNHISLDCMLGTALIDMYGKCGSVELARQLFFRLEDKNVFSWTAMIAAFAMEGHAKEAIDLFFEMEGIGLKPDHVTFIAVLSACSHGGLVNEGYKYLDKMRTSYKISPNIQHYGCMVDLLGRTGRLEEAVKFIEDMPIEPDVSIWSSLLKACGTHQNVRLAEYAFKKLIEIDPINGGAYMLLSNLYASTGRLHDVSRVRLKLHELGVKKPPGLSLMEQNGVVHQFTSADFSNPQSKEIYLLLEDLERRFPRELQDNSSRHSERLAVAFGLISNPRSSPIRVVNTVQLCRDCHSFMKLISKVYGREIVIRDNFRFHRFKDGHCSCKDNW